ncbi:uncharacterized protein A4U43_C03F13910 [Asparagus officinalis]|uniref:1-phosphatidylinositol-3-phosphate 5-kinase n=1 Tax=Asparagus officinalis TaxID=4686 RepID=A0A5P1FBN1_ASPOF|nr:1-phosphatidylinositol-3-phosphate 5-kinase FAB1B-like [Asparagus officinalis]ONK75153.1 uncharacterized protein A4U43_C03F13910 [Asparagus officinalis]
MSWQASPSLMDTPDTAFSEFVGRVKSWIPRRSEPPNVSRDFWMPDHSCRVCYECDSQFTIFNRRHHCRLCGRVFCGKCTANSVPISPYDPNNAREDVERIRVCNFCFKQWEQDMLSPRNGIRPHSDGFNPSLSAMSLVSSPDTDSSSSVMPSSFSYSTVSYQHGPYVHNLSRVQSAKLGLNLDNHDIRVSQRNSIHDIDVSSPNRFNFHMNRSDDEDEEYGMSRSDSETHHILHSDIYYGPVEFDETVQDYHSPDFHSVQENNETKEIDSPLHNNTESRVSIDADKMTDEAAPDNSCNDHTSSIYSLEAEDTEPMDFDNNEILWFPPDPEDEEDERESDVVAEDDDEDPTGEWGYNRTSTSSCSGEYRSRDRTSEEHKKAMKNVVDGHFRALIAQLLQVENVPMGDEGDKGSWLEIITGLSWEAATLLKPDTSTGGGMDPGGYVKIKCIACGHRSQSMVVKGIVCKKNVAHRRMTSKVQKPRFLILGGALEYQRVTNSLSSFDTLLQQEMDHLKMAVAKIDAHHPHVLLVEKSVSRFAQDYLLAKNISLVLNMKRPLLERIARCTGAQIVPSIDHLSSQKLGQCDLFHVEKFLEEHGSAGQGGRKMVKTLMFFEGCPKPLGCTILLKGASGDELKKLKHVIQYGIFAAYHLALETSFLADEGASLPELPLKSPITVASPDKPASICDKSISTIPGVAPSCVSKPQLTIDVQAHKEFVPALTSSSGNKGAPGSTFVSPVGMKKSPGEKRDQISTLAGLFSNSRQTSPRDTAREKNKVCFGEIREVETLRNNDQAVKHDANVPSRYSTGSQSLDRMPNDSQIQNEETTGQLVSSLANVLQENEQRTDCTLPKEEIPPDHQSILVSLSTRSVWKGAICERSHLFRIKYYGSFDKPLGRFLRDNLFDQTFKCCSCESPPEAHVHCYTHYQGSLTISVRRHAHLCLPGERDGKIWMWHRCLRCPRVHGFPPATRRIVMSDAAWGLSFGKFLELSFSNHAAASRVASCGHSLHRDCLRFYGFGERVACFRYASINVNNVYLPPHKLDFNCEHQEWIQREAEEVANRTQLLFNEVVNALQQIAEGRPTSSASTNGSMKIPELRNHILELEKMLQKEKVEFEDSLHKLQDKEARKGQPNIDILDVNKLRRQLLFLSYLWDQRLIFAAGSTSIAHEMLSGFLTRDREKASTNEKLAELNPAPKSQLSFTSSDTLSQDSRNGEPFKGNILSVSHQEGLYDEQKVDPDLDSFQGKQNNILLSTCTSASEQLDTLDLGLSTCRTLSDGQVPTLANLSETFDAKWIGEETAPVLADASMSDSASVEATAMMSVSEDSEERSGAEMTQSFTSALLGRLGDSAEDFPIWIGMPFPHIYRSVNKNLAIAPRFGALCDYSPVYISLFRELEHPGGARLLLPVGVDETVIPIYDDEPTSIICHALVSPVYRIQMSDERERMRDNADASLFQSSTEFGNSFLHQSTDEMNYEPFKSFGSSEDGVLSLVGGRSSVVSDPLTSAKAVHVRVSFCDEGPIGKVRYTVTCYYAKRFDALRRICCPSELDYIRSLSRCKKWGAQGGKSNVFFAKTLDDRFIIKQVTKTELESFIKFAPEYFRYLSDSIVTRSPTCLAKILGIYQVTSKHLKGGKDLKMDVLVMENLLFTRNITRLYDLKGSLRSRYNTDCNNKVLLDQNLLEATSPIFVRNKAKRLLERAVWNDTAFLASVAVMDYSLLVGVDEVKHELVLGIIDFMRQYTWDKHLENWVKASGILGGPKNVAPTVISPKQYKKRFRKAMTGYFLVVPDQWSALSTVPTSLQPDSSEDNQQEASLES